jgi:hypothetical protein
MVSGIWSARKPSLSYLDRCVRQATVASRKYTPAQALFAQDGDADLPSVAGIEPASILVP